ncbi:MAG: hypothetical protein QOH09_3123 [Pseudonocardiales bacterium]|jgi:hypothetical protein|nr:hypothetical protein [Pseudonocardiales bacterium]
MCRGLTLVRLQPWAAAREAALARLPARGGDGVGHGALIETVA